MMNRTTDDRDRDRDADRWTNLLVREGEREAVEAYLKQIRDASDGGV